MAQMNFADFASRSPVYTIGTPTSPSMGYTLQDTYADIRYAEGARMPSGLSQQADNIIDSLEQIRFLSIGRRLSMTDFIGICNKMEELKKALQPDASRGL